MIRVTLAADGGSTRIFIPKNEMRGLLDLPTEEAYQRGLELALQVGLLEAHRRNRSPARGYLLPEEWEGIHALHLARRVKRLMHENPPPVPEAEQPKVGRLLRWDI